MTLHQLAFAVDGFIT